ncbi:DUF3047 domain-containing protein [Hydrogenophaga sp. T2]|uniref:DUF3047 domain-containing protein n=1 Tax=Hydrogenophaga sp. T2 TaxID=3132823 RepID=UPI003CEBE33A
MFDTPHPTDWPRRRWLLGMGALALGGCASAPTADEPERLAQSAWARATTLDGVQASGPWVHRRYGNRQPTLYEASEREGRPALHARSVSGNSTLRLPLQPAALAPGARLQFSWWVPALLPHADLRSAEADDAVARIILTFDGDRASWSRRDHMLSELAQLVTGEPMPYATLIYVWDDRYPVGSVIDNPHTRRIRKLVVQSGTERLGRWVDHDRDVHDDFRLAFGHAPGALTGLGLMTDSNNTRVDTEAWYGPLALRGGLTAAAR